jgi:hypothetical protein
MVLERLSRSRILLARKMHGPNKFDLPIPLYEDIRGLQAPVRYGCNRVCAGGKMVKSPSDRPVSVIAA